MKERLRMVFFAMMFMGWCWMVFSHGPTIVHAGNDMDQLDQLDMLDTAVKNNLDESIKKARSCAKNWDFSCARNQLEAAKDYVVDFDDEKKLKEARAYYETQKEAKAEYDREQERQRRIAEERRNRQEERRNRQNDGYGSQGGKITITNREVRKHATVYEVECNYPYGGIYGYLYINDDGSFGYSSKCNDFDYHYVPSDEVNGNEDEVKKMICNCK